MREVFKYITKEQLEEHKKGLKDRETKVVYQDKLIKIRLKKIGRNYITTIVEYGTEDIVDLVNNSLIKAS